MNIDDPTPEAEDIEQPDFSLNTDPASRALPESGQVPEAEDTDRPEPDQNTDSESSILPDTWIQLVPGAFEGPEYEMEQEPGGIGLPDPDMTTEPDETGVNEFGLVTEDGGIVEPEYGLDAEADDFVNSEDEPGTESADIEQTGTGLRSESDNFGFTETEQFEECQPLISGPDETDSLQPQQDDPAGPESAPGEEIICGASPLEGLENLLPAGEITLQVQKSAPTAGNLQLTERQSMHSEILANMLEQNSQPAVHEPVESPGANGLLRILFALVLGAVVLFPILLPAFEINDANQQVNPTVQQFFNELYIIPKEAPLLIVADFEPGFYGEMKLISSPVFRHLVLRTSHLVFVSTNPSGSVMGESLLRDALSEMDNPQSKTASYDLQQQTENLGYLPGGLASLREIVFDIRRVTRFGLLTLRNKRSPWNGPSLDGINTITDFGAVILLVDNLDTGRAWIEQVQPSLGQTPLLVISSAQTWPVLEPYFQSGQIRGLLAGYNDAHAYEKVSGLPITGVNGVVSYQLAALLTAGIIMAGSLFVLISRVSGWLKPNKGGENYAAS